MHIQGLASLLVIPLLAGWQFSSQAMAPDTPPATGSVIFIHPDGASAAHYATLRLVDAGPDGKIHWDTLPAMAIYTEHVSDALTPSSNAGATIHAYGIKTPRRSYGTDGENPIVDAAGRSKSVMRQAQRAGMSIALINSGVHSEPGTGCFLTSVAARSMHEEIVEQLVTSEADILFGSGERYFLPAGVQGRHGIGVREDGRNLVKEAIALGYTVVYNRDEMMRVPVGTDKVLGIFAAEDSYNDQSEEALAAANLPMYWPDAPTVGEMTAAALRILRAKGRRFLMVVEEEGSDNFANVNNAPGTIEAMRRADEAIGVAIADVDQHGDALLITAADSNAGGMGFIGVGDDNRPAPARLPATSSNGAPLDGIGGTGTAPFTAKPDAAGRVHKFAVVWATFADMGGGVIARAKGINSHLVKGTIDNTDITAIIRATLFGNPDGPDE